MIRVRTDFAFLAASACLLASCGQSSQQGETADDYAARVAGGQTPAANVHQGAQTGADPQAAPPPQVMPDGSRGSALAAGAERCNAPFAKPFLNQPDSPATRAKIAEAVGSGATLRFLPAGTSDRVEDQTDRLNVMIDYTGVIRDLRCG
ncbi:hypothetical protein MKP08_10045 [Erythrobacter sp. LQ02-29]|uniref:hypothetical protein n=1 Tax=Erythrobacter sp. LQ02-29 TaxID=2920384 RepID=UPI001F4DFA57|nr:hypothetical protein [Erythrobacter sp. LQ02-29]MCP9223089.1 hypothetical protein [Erythrobacter sp. LQ02-29]